MAQKIKIRRGGIGNLSGTIAVSQGELLVATGSIASTDLGNVVFISNADGNNTYTPISTLYSGTATTFAAKLDGLPFYDSVNYKLLKLLSTGNTTLNLANNLAGNAITGSLTISSLLRVESNISASGNITGSSLYLSGNANIIGNLVLGGNITVGDSTSDSVAFGAEISSSVIPDVNNAFDLGSGAKAWKDLHVSGTAYIQSLTNVNTTLTGNLTVSGSTFLGDTTADKVNITGSLNVSGSTNFNNGNVLVAEDLAVNGGDITTTAATFNLINATATTANIAGAATTIALGANSGTLTIGNPTVVGTQTTQNLYNATATTINFGGGASAINIGASSGTITIASSTLVGTQTTQNLFNTAATTLNFAGAATTISMGANSGTLTIGNPTLVGTQTTQNLYNTVATTVNFAGGASTINLGANGGVVNIAGDLRLNGNDILASDGNTNITLTSNTLTTFAGDIKVSGNDIQASTGDVAITLSGFDVAIGGDLTVTGNDIKSSTATVITLSANDATFADNVAISGTTDSTSHSTGALQVAGGVGIGKNLYVSGSTFIAGNLTLLGAATSLVISSSIIELDDNIIRLNAFSPFQRYAGIEVIDSSSSATSGSLLWDSTGDYWLILSASASGSKLIGTTLAPQGSETSLTVNTIPKSTYSNTVGDSLLTDNATTLAYNTDKFIVVAASGNTNVGGTLIVTGSTTLEALLNANGGIAVDTNAFTVANTSGNTNVGGTFGVTGISTLAALLNANGGIAVDTNKFTVADSTGNTVIDGTLNVAGATTFSSTVGITGSLTLSAATATTFLHSNGSKVVTSTALTDTSGSADVYFVYSAASGFFATSVVDGGTY